MFDNLCNLYIEKKKVKEGISALLLKNIILLFAFLTNYYVENKN